MVENKTEAKHPSLFRSLKTYSKSRTITKIQPVCGFEQLDVILKNFRMIYEKLYI